MTHDCWNPGCIIAQRAGQSCALCLGCQIIRDAFNAMHAPPERRAAEGSGYRGPAITAGFPNGAAGSSVAQKGSSRS